ncbi:TPA: hypothetical protein ACJEU7_002469 [Acinetobacter baumannii]
MEINKNQIILVEDLHGNTQKIEFSVAIELHKNGVLLDYTGEFFLIACDFNNKKIFLNLDDSKNNVVYTKNGIQFSIELKDLDNLKSIDLYHRKNIYSVNFIDTKIKIGTNLGRTCLYQEMDYITTEFNPSSTYLSNLLSIYRTEENKKLRFKVKANNVELIEDQPFILMEYLVEFLGVEVLSLIDAEKIFPKGTVDFDLIQVLRGMKVSGIDSLPSNYLKIKNFERMDSVNIFFCKSISSKALYLDEEFKKIFWMICFQSVLVGNSFSFYLYSNFVEKLAVINSVDAFKEMFIRLVEEMRDTGGIYSDEFLLMKMIANDDSFKNSFNFIVYDRNMTDREAKELLKMSEKLEGRSSLLVDLNAVNSL